MDKTNVYEMNNAIDQDLREIVELLFKKTDMRRFRAECGDMSAFNVAENFIEEYGSKLSQAIYFQEKYKSKETMKRYIRHGANDIYELEAWLKMQAYIVEEVLDGMSISNRREALSSTVNC